MNQEKIAKMLISIFLMSEMFFGVGNIPVVNAIDTPKSQTLATFPEPHETKKEDVPHSEKDQIKTGPERQELLTSSGNIEMDQKSIEAVQTIIININVGGQMNATNKHYVEHFLKNKLYTKSKFMVYEGSKSYSFIEAALLTKRYALIGMFLDEVDGEYLLRHPKISKVFLNKLDDILTYKEGFLLKKLIQKGVASGVDYSIFCNLFASFIGKTSYRGVRKEFICDLIKSNPKIFDEILDKTIKEKNLKLLQKYINANNPKCIRDLYYDIFCKAVEYGSDDVLYSVAEELIKSGDNETLHKCIKHLFTNASYYRRHMFCTRTIRTAISHDDKYAFVDISSLISEKEFANIRYKMSDPRVECSPLQIAFLFDRKEIVNMVLGALSPSFKYSLKGIIDSFDEISDYIPRRFGVDAFNRYRLFKKYCETELGMLRKSDERLFFDLDFIRDEWKSLDGKRP